MVVIGFLGTTKDWAGRGARRWDRWRPTLSLCQHEDKVVTRLELLVNADSDALFEQLKQDISQVSPETQVRAHRLNMEDPWDFEQVYGALHDFARRYPFDDRNEDYYVHIVTGTHVAQICLFLLTESRYFPAKLIQTAPPIDRYASAGGLKIIDLDLSKYDRIAERFAREKQQGDSLLKLGVKTSNAAYNAMIDSIESVALKSAESMLLVGPSGAGKARLARSIYELKRMRHKLSGEFVVVSCMSLLDGQAASVLFGCKKGWGRDAAAARMGAVRQARQGVLFLRSVTALGLEEQGLLCQLLDNGCYTPLGSDRSLDLQCQVIASCSDQLNELVQQGKFRADLLARLSHWRYDVPGLSARREDISPNIDHELVRYSDLYSQNVTFNQLARKRYLDFCLSNEACWSGGFHDFSASMNRLATLAHGARIRLQEVEDEVKRLKTLWKVTTTDTVMQCLLTVLPQERIAELDLFDRVQLAAVINVCRQENSLSAAGRALYSKTREKKKMANDADRLSKFLARFRLSWKQVFP